MATSTRSKLSIPDDGPKSEYKFFREAKKQLLEGDFLHLTDVPEDFALPLIEGLQSDPVFGSEGKYQYNYENDNEKLLAFMPSELHNSLQLAIGDIIKDMFISNFISQNQWLLLGVSAGTTFSRFVGQYAGTRKEPNCQVNVDGRPQAPGAPAYCPIWVNETGYSESKPSLDRDITKWLVGTAYGVLLAIEAKFYKRQNSRVAGYVAFHTNNGTTINRKEIFPPPQNLANDQIAYTRQDLFGNTLPLEPGQTPGDVYNLDVLTIRRRAAEAAQMMNLTPV